MTGAARLSPTVVVLDTASGEKITVSGGKATVTVLDETGMPTWTSAVCAETVACSALRVDSQAEVDDLVAAAESTLLLSPTAKCIDPSHFDFGELAADYEVDCAYASSFLNKLSGVFAQGGDAAVTASICGYSATCEGFEVCEGWKAANCPEPHGKRRELNVAARVGAATLKSGYCPEIGNRGCHPAGSLLHLEGGGTLPIEKATVGTRIKTPTGYQPILGYLHAEDIQQMAYLRFSTTSASMSISPLHFLVVNGAKTDPSDVAIGDLLHTPNGLKPVTKVERVEARGAYHPLSRAESTTWTASSPRTTTAWSHRMCGPLVARTSKRATWSGCQLSPSAWAPFPTTHGRLILFPALGLARLPSASSSFLLPCSPVSSPR